MSGLQESGPQIEQAIAVKTWSDVAKPDEAQRMAEQESRAKWFARLFVPGAVYAVFYTIFTYQNDRGIGIFLWIAATAAYACYVMHAEAISLKRGSGALLTVMGLLGLSTILTSNDWLIACNHYGFCLLLLYFLLVQTRDTSGWSIWEAASGMFLAVIGAIGKIWAPFTEGYSWLRLHAQTRNKRCSDEQINKRHSTVLGVLISIPVLLFLASLLMSADAVFKSMMSCFTFTWTLSADAIGAGFTFLFGLFAAYCGMRHILEQKDGSAAAAQKKYPVITAQIVTSAVLVLYVWFCLVQVVYLFGGFGTLPDGMTYAQYARTGFFQLLFVCILNLFLVLTVRRCFENAKALTLSLCGICLCSYVMTASSAYRMILYIQAYHLTVLRVVVLVALATIAVLLAGVMMHVFNEKFRILPYFVAVVSMVYTLYSFSNAERLVVRYDLTYMTEDNADGILSYISGLSLDALPEVVSFLEQAEDGYAADVRNKLQTVCKTYDVQVGEHMFDYLHPDDETYGWFVQWLGYNRAALSDQSPMSWNLATSHARDMLNDFLRSTDESSALHS